MPHYADERTLVIAGEKTAFWHAIAPSEAELGSAASRRLREVHAHGCDGERESSRYESGSDASSVQTDRHSPRE
jgi:hypothetical protein